MCEITLQINARLRPLDRGDIYEDPIGEALEEAECGYTDGGGTMMSQSGEIDFCDVEISLNDNSDECIDTLMKIIDTIGVPKGSILHLENEDRSVGNLEGMAVYLNGTDLSDDVYQTCDINLVISEFERLIGDMGGFYSYWEGTQDTALYFYGSSYDEMSRLIKPFADEYPLCQKCRIGRIA